MRNIYIVVRFWTKVVPVRASQTGQLLRKEDEKVILLGAQKARGPLLAYYVGLEPLGSIPNVSNRDSHRHLHEWSTLRKNLSGGSHRDDSNQKACNRSRLCAKETSHFKGLSMSTLYIKRD